MSDVDTTSRKTLEDYERANDEARDGRAIREMAKAMAKEPPLIPRCQRCGWFLGPRAEESRRRGYCLRCWNFKQAGT